MSGADSQLDFVKAIGIQRPLLDLPQPSRPAAEAEVQFLWRRMKQHAKVKQRR